MGNRMFAATAVLLATVACNEDIAKPVPVVPVERFVARLSGDAERPTPVTTSASGVADFALFRRTDTTGTTRDTLTFVVSVNGLSGPPTGMHIHGPGDAETVAGVAHALTIAQGVRSGILAAGSVTTPTNGTISMDSLMTLIRAGLAYVNVHTAANPGGEIRGQIVRP